MAKSKLQKNQSQPKNKPSDVAEFGTYIEKAVQQNLNISIIPSEISEILNKNPDYAERVMQYLEVEQKQRFELEQTILQAEITEQEARLKNVPEYNKSMNRGQVFAVIVMLVALGVVGFAIYSHETGFAITSVIVVFLLSLYHISGKKEQSSIAWKKAINQTESKTK